MEQSPEQGQARSTPSLLIELKFKLDTQLTISCVVAVASAYSLATVSIALDSILLAFGNIVRRHPLINPVCFLLVEGALWQIWQGKICGKKIDR